MPEETDGRQTVRADVTEGPQIITVPPDGRVTIEIRAPAGAQVIVVGPSEEEEPEPVPAHTARDGASGDCLLETFGCLWKAAILPFQVAGMLVVLALTVSLLYVCLAILWVMLTGP